MIKGRPPSTAIKRYRSYLKSNYPEVLKEIDDMEIKYKKNKIRKMRAIKRSEGIVISKERLAEFHKDMEDRIERLNDDGWLNITRDKIKRGVEGVKW